MSSSVVIHLLRQALRNTHNDSTSSSSTGCWYVREVLQGADGAMLDDLRRAFSFSDWTKLQAIAKITSATATAAAAASPTFTEEDISAETSDRDSENQQQQQKQVERQRPLSRGSKPRQRILALRQQQQEQQQREEHGSNNNAKPSGYTRDVEARQILTLATAHSAAATWTSAQIRESDPGIDLEKQSTTSDEEFDEEAQEENEEDDKPPRDASASSACATATQAETETETEAASAAAAPTVLFAGSENTAPSYAQVLRSQSKAWAESSARLRQLQRMADRATTLLDAPLDSDASNKEGGTGRSDVIPKAFLDMEYLMNIRSMPDEVKQLVTPRDKEERARRFKGKSEEYARGFRKVAQRLVERSANAMWEEGDEHDEDTNMDVLELVPKALPMTKPGATAADARAHIAKTASRSVKVPIKCRRELAGGIMQFGIETDDSEQRKRRWKPAFSAVDEIEKSLYSMETHSRRSVDDETFNHPSRATERAKEQVLSEGLQEESEEISAFLLPWLLDIGQRLTILLSYEQIKQKNRIHMLQNRATQTMAVTVMDDDDRQREKELSKEKKKKKQHKKKTRRGKETDTSDSSAGSSPSSSSSSSSEDEDERRMKEIRGAKQNSGGFGALDESVNANSAAAAEEEGSLLFGSPGRDVTANKKRNKKLHNPYSFQLIARRFVAAMRVQSAFRGFYTRCIVGNVHTGRRTYFQSFDIRIARLWCRHICHKTPHLVPIQSPVWLLDSCTNLLIGHVAAAYLAEAAGGIHRIKGERVVDFIISHFSSAYGTSLNEGRRNLCIFLATLDHLKHTDPVFTLLFHLVMGDFTPWQERTLARVTLAVAKACAVHPEAVTPQYLALDLHKETMLKGVQVRHVIRSVCRANELQSVLRRLHYLTDWLLPFHMSGKMIAVDGHVYRQITQVPKNPRTLADADSGVFGDENAEGQQQGAGATTTRDDKRDPIAVVGGFGELDLDVSSSATFVKRTTSGNNNSNTLGGSSTFGETDYDMYAGDDADFLTGGSTSIASPTALSPKKARGISRMRREDAAKKAALKAVAADMSTAEGDRRMSHKRLLLLLVYAMLDAHVQTED